MDFMLFVKVVVDFEVCTTVKYDEEEVEYNDSSEVVCQARSDKFLLLLGD